ncbi:MAG: indole-3-glycerol phosphate synthase TrpC [Anaerolineales bacterium]|nr:indole-3-glycerol phosphate synthase TrpC [Anaerolineales bacterium]
MNILEEIFAYKRVEIEQRKQSRPLESVRAAAMKTPVPANFVQALQKARGANHSPALIAEIKFASPSRGTLVEAPNPLRLARIYQQNGAAAISVLTDEKYFHGHLNYLRDVSGLQTGLPTLRKDFIYDEYQLLEARAAGASAALLIAAMLPARDLRLLHETARNLGLTPLVEVHNERELETAMDCRPVLVGVNNRDLRDFSTNLQTSFRLRKLIPAEIVMVSESGINSKADINLLKAANVDAILVGEALVAASDTADQVRLFSGTA